MFQSLIGKLQTSLVMEIADLLVEFQSLIGKLQTGDSVAPRVRVYGVSIPHREATNLLCSLQVDYRAGVSIPHREATNIERLCTAIRMGNYLFQSLIGKLQTGYRCIL